MVNYFHDPAFEFIASNKQKLCAVFELRKIDAQRLKHVHIFFDANDARWNRFIGIGCA